MDQQITNPTIMPLYWREVTNPAALRHIHQHLEWGTTLATLLSMQLDFVNGKVFTLMPPEVSQARLVLSEQSGYDDWIAITDPTQPQSLCVEYLQTYLLRNPKMICVLAEILLHAGERMSADEKKVQYTYKDEVYFMFAAEQLGGMNVLQLVRSVLAGWGAIIVLTSLPDGPQALPLTRKLTREQLQLLAERTMVLVVGAHDGGGVLIWQK